MLMEERESYRCQEEHRVHTSGKQSKDREPKAAIRQDWLDPDVMFILKYNERWAVGLGKGEKEKSSIKSRETYVWLSTTIQEQI